MSNETMTPFEPRKSEVVAWVEDRCERIANAKPRGRFQSFRQACLAVTTVSFPGASQGVNPWVLDDMLAAVDTIRWAACAAGLTERAIKRTADDIAAEINRQRSPEAAALRERAPHSVILMDDE